MLTLHPQTHPHLFNLAEFLGPSSAQAWLVGGTIRDLVRGQRPADYDIAFNGDLSSEIFAWARQLRGSWFWLDETRSQSRVMFENDRLQFDFAPLRAGTIEEDLRLRDFTINALALPLQALPAGDLIDPLDGQDDLSRGILRICSAGVLQDDPLRCLKGVRHHAQHGWRFEPESLRRIREAAHLLRQIAGERLRTELAYILSAPRLASAIHWLVETGLAQEMFPSFDGRKFQVLFANTQKRLVRLGAFDIFQSALAKDCEALLSLRSLLILALILDSTDQHQPALVERLRLSRKSQRVLKVLQDVEPLCLEFNPQDSPRVSALRVEQIGYEPVARLLYTLLRSRDSDLDSASADAVKYYLIHLKQGRVPDLMGGSALKEQYPRLSGREIGILQKRIKGAEIKGEIKERGEVPGWLERQFSN